MKRLTVILFFLSCFIVRFSPGPLFADAEEQNEDKIQVFDEQGNEMFLDKQQWRDEVILKQFEEDWERPDELYVDIVYALEDGFFEDVLKPTERLLEIDPNKERSHVIRGIALFKNGRLEEAEKVFHSYLTKEGPSGTVLTNLAKVEWEKGNQKKARKTLWKGLLLDPNQENGLGWWLALQYEENGEEGYYAALNQAAQVKDSWRPQLLLGGIALAQNNLVEAMTLYEHVLSHASEDGQVIMAISGELGSHGFLDELIQLIQPIYNPGKHDIEAGINLLQAYLETENVELGKQLISQLLKLERHDFKEHLMFYQENFDRLEAT